MGRWRQLWGRAGVEKVGGFEEWENESISSAESRFGVVGFFSLTASHSKSSQFICELLILASTLIPLLTPYPYFPDVNSRPLSPCPLHTLVNRLFSQSTFSRHAVSHLVVPSSSPNSKSAPGTKASRKSPKKTSERHPIFVLNLLAPPEMVDVTLEPEKRVVEFQVCGFLSFDAFRLKD